MKKIFALVFFAALNLNLMATDIWGNNGIWNSSKGNDESTGNNTENIDNSPIFRGSEWLSANRGDIGWEGDEDNGSKDKKPGVPVGEGVLILLAGGALYTATKLRRKK